MKKKIICLMLTLIIAIIQLPIYASAEEIVLDTKFDGTDSSELIDLWSLPEGYTISEDGIECGRKNSQMIYTGAICSGKYEITFDVMFPYVSSASFIFNYKDAANYQAVAFNPQFNQAILQNMKDGYLRGVQEIKLDFTVLATKWYSVRIVSNGGEGISAYISDEGATHTLFENCYVEDSLEAGYVGYNSKTNTLQLKNFKVTALGEKDFVKLAEPVITKPDNEEPSILDEKEAADGVYDESLLELCIALGVIPDTYRGLGWRYMTKDSFAEIMSRLNVLTSGGEENITLKDGFDGMLSALGYNQYLSSTYERIKASVKNRLRSGAVIKDSEYMTYHDMAKLIYNALDEKMLLFRSSYGNQAEFKTEDGKTLLKEVLNADIAEGQVSDNYVSALAGDTRFGKTMLYIDGKELFIDADLHSIYNYLGRYVKAYYLTDDYTGDGNILWIQYHEDEEVIEIDAEDFISYENYTIKYTSSGRKKTKSFLPASKLIYNGKSDASYDKDTFDIQNGNIKLVRYKNDFDTVIITEYEDFVVNSVDVDSTKVYSKVNYRYSKDKNYVLSLPEDIKYEIQNTEGVSMSIEELTADDILSVIKNDELALITVSRNIKKFFDIYSIYEEEGRHYISGSGGEVEICDYEISSYCTDSDMVREFIPGQTIDLYINAFGKGVWAKFVKSQESLVGCLAKATFDADEEQTKLFVYKDDGMPQIYDCTEKVTFLDENGVKRRLDEKELYNKLNGRNELVTFFINDLDEIRHVELAASSFSPLNENSNSLLANETLKYNSAGNFGSRYFIPDNAKIFAVNTSEKDNIYRYTLISRWSLQNSISFNMKLYGDDNDIFVKYAILYDVRNNNFPASQSKTAIVTDISTGLYEDEVCTKITCFNGGEIVLYTEPEIEICDPFSYMEGEQKKQRELRRGDIIRYSSDIVNGKVKQILVLYSYYEESPLTGEKGWIVGSIGGLSDDLGKTNPYCYEVASDGTHLSFDKNVYISDFDSYSKFRISYGTVFRKVDDVLELTTEDLNARSGAYASLDSNNFYTCRIKMSTDTNILAKLNVNSANIRVSASVANLKQIHTYEEVGADCTRFVRIQNNFGNQIFFINTDNE